VKHVFSRSDVEQNTGPLLLTLVTYATLTMGMPGLSVPMGTFIPNMLVGGILGRLWGKVTASVGANIGFSVAPPGIYAVVGSAAMLSGFTHMTVGIVALLAEAINNLGLIVPLMTAVYIANFVSKCISPHGYDEKLIVSKGVPFLESDMPKEMDSSSLTALDICFIPPKEAILPRKATIKTIKRALRHREVNYFPIVSDMGHCVGVTTRGRLKAVLTAIGHAPGVIHPTETDMSSSSTAPVTVGRRSSFESNASGDQPTIEWPSQPSLRPGSLRQLWRRTFRRREEPQSPRRSSQGHLADHQVESKMRGLIRDLFAKRPDGSMTSADFADDGRRTACCPSIALWTLRPT
jgi:hypothetical protein